MAGVNHICAQGLLKACTHLSLFGGKTVFVLYSICSPSLNKLGLV